MPMRFPYLKSARVKLQERQKSCLKAAYEAAGTHTRFFLEFIKTDPVICSITTELSVIAVEKFGDGDALIDSRQRRLRLPESQIDCAAFWMRCLEVLLERDLNFPNFPMIFGSGSNHIQDMYNDFFEQVLNPLCSYIDERIDEGDLLLYSLSRYQRECGWFEAESLAKLATDAESGKLEAAMDGHLRSWLFREGIDYPFSTPSSPSGRADVVVWHGEKPLPLEVKVFDGVNRDTGHVSQGLWQAHRYAADYTVPFGYLVVFNTSPYELSFADNIHKDGPPCVLVSGMNVFAIVVRVGPRRDTASKENPLETKMVKTPGSAEG